MYFINTHPTMYKYFDQFLVSSINASYTPLYTIFFCYSQCKIFWVHTLYQAQIDTHNLQRNTKLQFTRNPDIIKQANVCNWYYHQQMIYSPQLKPVTHQKPPTHNNMKGRKDITRQEETGTTYKTNHDHGQTRTSHLNTQHNKTRQRCPYITSHMGSHLKMPH